MNIALFGASGRTGTLLVERALAAGHQITALVRNPAKFAFADRVTVVQGNAFDPAAIAATLAGAEIVLSALGARSLGREEVLERSTPLIVSAMEQAAIQRIIVLGSAGALDSALDKQPAWRRWIVQNIVYNTMLKWPVTSTRAEYNALAASSLDWTMVMPPMLMNLPARGPGRIRIDADALPRLAACIARADVADFMIAQLTSSQWSRRGVYISW